MLNLTLENINSHWNESSKRFSIYHASWELIYGDILQSMGEILEAISGKRRLTENCAYLLLSKGVNHSLSSFVLAQRGLVIDAALSARNGLETLLLLQLCTLDTTGELFERWSQGESFRPVWVRQELEKLDEVEILDVIVSRPMPDDTYTIAYKWLSDITHANLASLNYTVHPQNGNKEFEVLVGGNLEHHKYAIHAIFSVLCFTLLTTGVLCASVFALDYVESNQSKLSILQGRLNETTKMNLQNGT
ncbi:MAG: hypothetical protein HOC20_11655 [Chloroflexi bacterium]|jgi:hypothetical protein|nr:hypothetical protein [Chloroflexota bacterium]